MAATALTPSSQHSAVDRINRNPAVLSDWRERQELEPLLEALLDPRVRRGWRLTVLNWLPDFGDSRVVPALVQALADADFGIRGSAADALAHCFDRGIPVCEAVAFHEPPNSGRRWAWSAASSRGGDVFH